MELTYINTSGESITLNQSRPFFITKIDGTGNIRQTVNTFKAPEQDGAFYVSSTMDMRNITLEGTIIANTPDEAYELRKSFLRLFSPKKSGVIKYRERQIACVIEEAVLSVSTRERIPSFFISLLCPSPFFETLDEVREDLASWNALLEFALEIPEEGLQFGLRQPSQIITVENIGDVPCGCEIIFKATGSVTNPELLHLDTGEYVRILSSMEQGDEFHIFTHFAGKRVRSIIGATESNAFHLLDTGSNFFQLAPGINNLRYDASNNLELLDVSVYYRPQFLGV
ncbi:tail protein [Mobilisporobacter senegalensis]|uniref:Tail protein n=1 Tax=Mobilisporobacter senegalensis TaxID=1329262 RepID=A0A3N1XTA7_9FIRM|nr:phage tail family protein [Mobilisporobacter senegalensis]ROR28097.1 tail protein [Mobilisporobacter senegalensis]